MRIDKQYQKVEGQQGLFRDPTNRAIINMNTLEIQKAVARKKITLQKQEEFAQVKNDVNQMKDDISYIKNLLTKLAEK